MCVTRCIVFIGILSKEYEISKHTFVLLAEYEEQVHVLIIIDLSLSTV